MAFFKESFFLNTFCSRSFRAGKKFSIHNVNPQPMSFGSMSLFFLCKIYLYACEVAIQREEMWGFLLLVRTMKNTEDGQTYSRQILNEKICLHGNLGTLQNSLHNVT